MFFKSALFFCFCYLSSSAWSFATARPSKEVFSKAFGERRSEWALRLFEKYSNRSKKYNKEFFVFVDYKRHVSKRRFYIVNPNSGKALGYRTTHGYGSDRNKDGFVDKVSNISCSGASSEGVFLTMGLRPSDKFGKTVHLRGLTKSNSRANSRLLRVHPAKDKHGKDYLSMGKPSGGCFALNIRLASEVMKTLSAKPTIIIATFSDNIR